MSKSYRRRDGGYTKATKHGPMTAGNQSPGGRNSPDLGVYGPGYGYGGMGTMDPGNLESKHKRRRMK